MESHAVEPHVERGTVATADIEFAYLATGGSGPLALCLHGFPDTAHTWRYLMPALAGRGYRAVAPFMRGYAPTSLAADGVYQTGALAHDANRLHEALGGDADAVIIGHDWGAVATHGAAVSEPDRWRRVVTMAVPPGPVLAGAFLNDLDQLRRSWYMFFLLHPLANLIVPSNDFAFITRLWSDWSPGYDASVDVAHVRESLAEPEHLNAAITYYRATLGDATRAEQFSASQDATMQIPPQPTMYLQGRNDGCVGADLVEQAFALYPEHVVPHMIDGAGHFLQLEQPDVVNKLVTEFVS
jgi:pimeloyl-ACP methyl ester carboxylesterase